MSTTVMVDEDELDTLHWEIIDVLREGRSIPSHLASRTGESRQLISRRLKELRMANVVTKVHRGLYELNPEEVPETETDQ
jgi:DNA-binding transcriptional ArsR family regulator